MVGTIRTSILVLAFSLLAARAPAEERSAEDAGGEPGLREGEIITLEHVDRLKPYLPKQFWDNRDMFFYEGMELEVGPTQFDYSPSAEFEAATERFRGQPRIGPDGSLENWVAGRPFPGEIDCKTDPHAGAKIMWNFSSLGADGSAHFYYSYWDRGEQLPLYYEGSGRTALLAHRFEARYLDDQESPGDVFRGEKRKNANSVNVDAPFDARGIKLLSYRYKASDGPLAETKYDDTWVYVPTLRRVRTLRVLIVSRATGRQKGRAGFSEITLLRR